MEIYIVALHVLILLVTAYYIFQADHLGFKWVSGKINKLDEIVLKKYHNRIFAGLIGMMITGVLLFIPQKEVLLSRPQFYVKMGFVLVLFINSFFISLLMKKTTLKSFKETNSKERIMMYIGGFLSLSGWVGATIAAMFILPE